MAGQVTYGHQMASFDTISPPREAAENVSSILVCRLYRYASDTLDTYAGLAALLEFDLHYEIDTIGSKTETSK